MSRRCAGGLAVIGVCCGVACGPAAVPSAAPVTATTASAPVTAPVAPEPATAELAAPSPRPASVVASVTIPRPRAVQAYLAPFLRGTAYATLGEADLADLAVGLVGQPLASVLDFDQPVHLALSGEDGKQIVVSVAARGDLRAVAQRLSGQVELEKTNGGGYRADVGGGVGAVHCELRRGPAVAQARVLCGTSADAVSEDAPWLVGLAASPPPAVLVRLDATEALYSKASVDLEKDAADATERFLAKFVLGFRKDMLRGGLDFSAGHGALFGFESVFGSEDSPLTAWLLSSPTRAVRDQPVFWRQPKDCLNALHWSGGDPARIAKHRAALLDEFTAGATEGFDDQTRAEERRVLDGLLFTGGPITIFHGMDLAKAEAALVARAKKHEKLDQTRKRMSEWVLVHLDEPAKKWIDGLREVDAVETRARKRGAKPTSSDHEKRYITSGQELTVSSASHLPKGSAHWRDSSKPNPKYVPTPDKPAGIAHDSHVYVVPDGDTTWFGFSDDDATIRGKLLEVLSGKTRIPDGSASAEGRLAATSAVAFGLTSPAGWAAMGLHTESDAELDASAKRLAEDGALGPARFERVAFALKRDQDERGHARLRLELDVPESVIAALASDRTKP